MRLIFADLLIYFSVNDAITQKNFLYSRINKEDFPHVSTRYNVEKLKSMLINIDLSIRTYKKTDICLKVQGFPLSLHPGYTIRFIITIKTAVSDFLQSDTAVLFYLIICPLLLLQCVCRLQIQEGYYCQ